MRFGPSASGDISPERDAGSTEHIAWSKNRIGPYMVSPVCYGDFLYTCNSSGILECLEATTGERVYRKRISSGNSTSFVASLLAADGHIYVPAEEGNMIVVRAGREFEKVAENPLGESLHATPAISDGVMYIRGAKHLVAVTEKSSGSAEGALQLRQESP
jgi:outer membrane protein assembly factor BamB